MLIKKISSLVLLTLLLLTGCRRAAEPTPEATQTPAPPPLSVTYCDINPSDLCLEGFSLEFEDGLMILFKADDRFFADIYILVDNPDGEIFFECQQSEHFLENVFCLGEPFEEGELIKLDIYSKSSDELIAQGVFNVQQGNLPFPDVVFEKNTTPTPSPETASTLSPTLPPSYQNPSYPNPSYPNPTSAP